jgi:hypothetical protein
VKDLCPSLLGSRSTSLKFDEHRAVLAGDENVMSWATKTENERYTKCVGLFGVKHTHLSSMVHYENYGTGSPLRTNLRSSESSSRNVDALHAIKLEPVKQRSPGKTASDSGIAHLDAIRELTASNQALQRRRGSRGSAAVMRIPPRAHTISSRFRAFDGLAKMERRVHAGLFHLDDNNQLGTTRSDLIIILDMA